MGIRTGLPEITAGFAVATLPAVPLFTEALLSAAVLAAGAWAGAAGVAGLFVATGIVAEAGRFVVEGAAVTG